MWAFPVQYNGWGNGVSTGQMDIQIVVNGERRAAPEGQTITALLLDLRLEPTRVAVELDRRIVKQPQWDTTLLRDGAQLEIVQFVGGG
jgi:sulfur carrier protein